MIRIIGQMISCFSSALADDMFGCSAFYSLNSFAFVIDFDAEQVNSFAFVIDFDAEQVFDMDIVFVLSGISSLSFFNLSL